MKVSHKAIYIDDKETETGRHRLLFICPGCNQLHAPTVSLPRVPDGGGTALWTWNNNEEVPTLDPSVLVSWHGDKPHVCHSFVRDGQIQFLPDSTHELAGQTVPLPEWPEGYMGIR